MSSLLSWIRKELSYLKGSLLLIIKGFLIFVLATSGLGVAILLRNLNYNGSTIALAGTLIEALSMISCYFIFKKYLKQVDESKLPEKKSKKP